MSFISFSLGPYNLPTYHIKDDRYMTLGVWLITDISIYLQTCLDGLAMLDDVIHGREPFEEWSSDKFDVSFRPDGVTLQNLWLEDQHGEYSIEETREALESYWVFLMNTPEDKALIREYHPELPQWQADLLQWEETWGRPHPYRGRLF